MRAWKFHVGVLAFVLVVPAVSALGVSLAGAPQAVQADPVDANVHVDPQDADSPAVASGEDVPDSTWTVSAPEEEEWMRPDYWHESFRDEWEDQGHEHDHERTDEAHEEPEAPESEEEAASEEAEPVDEEEEESPENAFLPNPATLGGEIVEETVPESPLSDLLQRILTEIGEAWSSVTSDGEPAEEDAPTALEQHTVPEAPPAETESAAVAPGPGPVEGAAAALTVAAAGAAGWALGLHTLLASKLKKIIAVAGFTRLAKGELLEHDGRDRLFAYVRDHPGCSLTELVDAHGGGRNTVTYHMRVLEREGLISSRREGRARLYFAADAGAPARAHAPALAALRHDTTRAVAERVAADPGIDQQGLCRMLGLAPSLAHWHLGRLAEAGVVRKERDGRRVRYYPTPDWATLTSIGPA